METLDPWDSQTRPPLAEMADLNPLDDSSLSTILMDLQEGTFLSLLEDDHLFSDLKSCPLSPGCDTASVSSWDSGLEALFGDHCELVEYGMRELDASLPVQGSHEDTTRKQGISSEAMEIKAVTSRSVSPSKPRSSSRQNTKAHTRKKPVRVHTSESDTESSVESSSTDTDAVECEDVRSQVQDTLDRKHILSCVQHDHCYTSRVKDGSPTRRRLPVCTERDSNEEGSSSDTGYDTMSASTSPGDSSTSNTSPTTHSPKLSSSPIVLPTPLPSVSTLPPLGANVDPVALIDARIKYFMCSRQVTLTEEEKATLKAEGLPIPTTLPLTKAEEKALKSVRRKIRNKMAAQESRKRKKEHLHTLEDRVRQCTSNNLRLKRKVETLESENKSLVTQLRKLQSIVASTTTVTNNRTTQVGACLMVIVLCFAIFFGGNWSPHRLWNPSTASDYATSTVRSRSLLSLENPQNFQKAACDWFSYYFTGTPYLLSPLDDENHQHDSSDRSEIWQLKGLDVYSSPMTPATRDNDTEDSHNVISDSANA